MIDIIPTGKILGATVNGLDLSQALADAACDQILRALGRYGVLRFPHQARVFVAAESEKWAKVIQFAGIKPE